MCWLCLVNLDGYSSEAGSDIDSALFTDGAIPEAESSADRGLPTTRPFQAYLAEKLKYKPSIEKPPFTPRQLIACAIESAKSGLTEAELVDTIQDSFTYYANHKCQHQCTWVLYETSCRRRELEHAITTELRRLTSPFSMSGDKYIINTLHVESIVSGKEQLSVFELFLQFPPEIRLEVYKHVLVYDEIGFHEKNDASSCCDACAPFAQRIGFNVSVSGRLIPFADPQQMLGLLRVNRQIFSEAHPVFYLENLFRFRTVVTLRHFLQGIGDQRRAYIRRVVVEYACATGSFTADSGAAHSAFTLLSQAQSIKLFELHLNESLLCNGHRSIKKPTSITGIWRLGKFRGVQQVKFQGCPQIEAYLKGLMTLPKPSQQVKKRKPACKPERPTSPGPANRRLREKKDVSYDYGESASNCNEEDEDFIATSSCDEMVKL